VSTGASHPSSADWRERHPSRIDLCVQFRGPWSARGAVARRLAQRLQGFQVSVAVTPDSVVLRQPERGISPALCQGVCHWLSEQPEVLSVAPIALQVWELA
jgi:hypothetical protein